MNILEDVVERDSSYWDAYLGLGIYHYLADVLPKFVKVLSFILGIDGDRARGIRELNMAVEKGTYTQTEAMFFLGAIYTYRERDYNRAIDIWNRLLKRYPDNPGVLVHLGACYGRMGQCDKAMKVYTKTLETISDSMLIPVSSVYYQMGQVQFRLNRFDEAIGSFEKSVATDSLFSGNRRWTYGWSHYWLGRAYEMIGNTVKARYHYRAAMDDDNERLQRRASENLEEPMDEVDKRLTIARNLSECNDYQNALAMLESVLKKISDAGKNSGNNDKTEQISYDMAEIYYKLGRYYLAINTLNDLLSRPDAKGKRYFYWAHYYRAASYVRIGMKQKALEDYEVASEDDDDFLQDQIRQDKTMLNID
jgi:tetratricopeptide (TPR) repeat protein